MSKEKKVAVAFDSITKRFPPNVVANDQISFKIEQGTIHALLGENGAGKTTLMNVLYGLYRPDEGRILLHDEPVHITSPQAAIQFGIGMVHQQRRLIDSLTVAENISLGDSSISFFFPLRKVERKVKELSTAYGLIVDPRTKVGALSAGEKQRVEILRALSRKARILILDEPTTDLTPIETNSFFTTLRQMADKGLTVIFITHNLREVLEVADRVTVLRQGRVIDSLESYETNVTTLAEMMVGRKITPLLKKKSRKPGKEVLRLSKVQVFNEEGAPVLKDLSLILYEGEILGVAGVAGNGQKELDELVTGLRQASKGEMIIAGKRLIKFSPRRAIELGVAHIPDDRSMAQVLALDVASNLRLKDYRRPPFARWGLINRGAVTQYAQRTIEKFKIVTPSPTTPNSSLSGGNRQRVILARELSSNPTLIVAFQPTAGLDVMAARDIHELLLSERERGKAILLISGDLDEITSLSDRIAVMFQGEIMGVVKAQNTDKRALGLMMGGERMEETR